jgi:hypothetical protein
MNKPAVALATGVWILNVVFLVLGKSHSTSPAKLTETLTILLLVPGALQVKIYPHFFCILIYWADSFKIHSTWLPTKNVCTPEDAESNKSAFIVTFATDVALILIMLVGLLRLRNASGGWFDLGRVLWKQVSWRACFADRGLSPSANVISVREGVVWLSLATVAELLPAVRLACLLLYCHPSLFCVTVVRVFESERYFCFPQI